MAKYDYFGATGADAVFGRIHPSHTFAFGGGTNSVATASYLGVSRPGVRCTTPVNATGGLGINTKSQVYTGRTSLLVFLEQPLGTQTGFDAPTLRVQVDNDGDFVNGNGAQWYGNLCPGWNHLCWHRGREVQTDLGPISGWVEHNGLAPSAADPSGTNWDTVVTRYQFTVGGSGTGLQTRAVFTDLLDDELATDTPMVCLIYDDGGDSFMTDAKPHLDTYGLKANIAVVLNWMNTSSSFMSQADIRTAYSEGHDVLPHSSIHASAATMAGYTLQQWKDEWNPIIDWIGANVNRYKNAKTAVSPFGLLQNRDQAVGRQAFDEMGIALEFGTAHGVVSQLTPRIRNRFLNRIHVDTFSSRLAANNTTITPTIAQICQMILSAITAKNDCHLMLHYLVAGSPTEAKELSVADHLTLVRFLWQCQQVGLCKVATMSEYMKARGV